MADHSDGRSGTGEATASIRVSGFDAVPACLVRLVRQADADLNRNSDGTTTGARPTPCCTLVLHHGLPPPAVLGQPG